MIFFKRIEYTFFNLKIITDKNIDKNIQEISDQNRINIEITLLLVAIHSFTLSVTLRARTHTYTQIHTHTHIIRGEDSFFNDILRKLSF